jgi:excisionase family DNA binding protein
MVPASVDRPLLVHHVARLLSVPRRTVRYWAAIGRLPATKAGPRRWKFRRTDVERFALAPRRCRRARRPPRAPWR